MIAVETLAVAVCQNTVINDITICDEDTNNDVTMNINLIASNFCTKNKGVKRLDSVKKI